MNNGLSPRLPLERGRAAYRFVPPAYAIRGAGATDGVNDAFQTSALNGTPLPTELSFSYWVRSPTGSVSGLQWWALRPGSSSNNNLGAWNFGGPLRVFAGGQFITVLAAVAAGQWYHIAHVVAGGTQRAFLNGQLLSTAPSHAVPAYGDIAIGAALTSAPAFHLTEFAHWARALSATEVARLYNAGRGFDARRLHFADLVWYWQFDARQTGTTVPDASGNGHDLAALNGAAVVPFV